MLLHSTRSNAGLIPQRSPSLATAKPFSKSSPESMRPASVYTSFREDNLPEDLFGDAAQAVTAEASSWHADCPKGPLQQADLDAMDAFAATMVEIGSVKLNDEQRLAVTAMVTSSSGRKPFAIFGPPGAFFSKYHFGWFLAKLSRILSRLECMYSVNQCCCFGRNIA